MKKLLFLVNPSAGRTIIKNRLYEIVEIFYNFGYETTVYPLIAENGSEDMTRYHGGEYDLVVCAGGDGTLDRTVTGIMKCEDPVNLGYIPCGTTNDFAKSLGIPKDPIRAAKRAVKYQPSPIDIGSMTALDEGKNSVDYFVYIASFGAFTDVAYSTPQNLKNAFGHTAYLMEAVKSITSLKSYYVKVESEEMTTEGSYIFAMVSNSNSVGGFKAIGARNVEFDDGLFEVVLINYPKTPLELQTIVGSIIMGDYSCPYIRTFKTKRVKFTCEQAIPWDLDGEYGGHHRSIEINVKEHALKLVRK